MRNGVIRNRHPDQILLGRLYGFTYGLRHFFRFSVAVSNMSAFVAHNDQRTKAQVFTTLHNLRHTIDRNYGIFQLKL